MAKIEKLTAAQECDLRDTYQHWLAVGRSTAPLDREAAARAIGDMYAAIGEQRPAVIYFSSPPMCVLAYGVLRNFSGQLWGQLRGQLRGQFDDQLWDQLGDQLGDQLWGQLGDQLGDQLWDQLDDQLRDQLGDQLWDQLRGQLRGQLRDQLNNYFAGAHWCAWEAFYDFCRKIGIKYAGDQNAKLDLWLSQSRSCHWWFPYRGIVLASERHNVLHVDDAGRLHCEDGPAVAYPDGWGVWSWHGVRVPQQVIEQPQLIAVPQIDGERNAELRRVLMERYGHERYLRDSGAKAIQQDARGTLYRKEIPDDEPLVMVKVRNSTPEPDGSVKDYWLRVPPTMKTASEAVAWTFGVEPAEYAPAVET